MEKRVCDGSDNRRLLTNNNDDLKLQFAHLNNQRGKGDCVRFSFLTRASVYKEG